MAGVLDGAKSLGADKKKLGLIAGLVGVLLVVLVMRFVFPSGVDTADSARASNGYGRGRPSLLDSQPEYLETIAKIARLQSEKSYEVGDSRDPMEPLIKERTSRPPEPQRTVDVPASNDLPRMSLHGVIWDSDNPIAIIDGLDLRVGDTIKGACVVEIGYDQVVLTYRSRRHVLTVD